MSTSVPVPQPTDLHIVRGTHDGWRRDLLAENSIEYRVWRDDGGGDTVKDEVVATTNGTAAALTAAATGISLVSGTSDNGTAQYHTGLGYSGDVGALMECVITLPATITTMKVEVGFTDATNDNGGAVLVKATPTATADDHASFVWDTDDDGEWGFHSAKATTVQSEALTKFTPAASTSYRMGVRIDGDNATGYINGEEVASIGGGLGIEGATAVSAYALVIARAGSASRTVALNNFRVIAPAY